MLIFSGSFENYRSMQMDRDKIVFFTIKYESSLTNKGMIRYHDGLAFYSYPSPLI